MLEGVETTKTRYDKKTSFDVQRAQCWKLLHTMTPPKGWGSKELAQKSPHLGTEEIAPFLLERAAPDDKVVPNDPTLPSPTAVAQFIYPECTDSCLIFINGTFHPLLSRLEALQDVACLPLAEAEMTYGSFLKQRLTPHIGAGASFLSLLSMATHPEGVFLYIPKGIRVKSPIQCLHLVTEATACLLPRYQISMGKGSEAQFLMTTHSLGTQEAMIHTEIDLFMDQDALCHVTHLGVFDSRLTQNLRLFSSLKQGAILKKVSVTYGGIIAHEDHHIQLLEERSSATLQGIALLKEKKEASTSVLIEHLAPHTHSSQHFKAVLKQGARSRFKGKIKVDQIAQKTESYQLNNHLILDENAFAESDPALEICADDVKASHGATVTQIDKEQLLYLKTRGIDEVLGKELLVRGFAQEITDQIPHPFLIKQLHQDSFSYAL